MSERNMGGYVVQQSEPRLIEALFSRDPSVPLPETEPGAAELNFGLILSRENPRELTVLLRTEVRGLPWLSHQTIVVSYEISYRIRGVSSDEDVEANIAMLARHTGPVVLYPYIREIVSSLTAKSGLHIMLPLVKWDEIFSDAEIPTPDSAPAPPELLEPLGNAG